MENNTALSGMKAISQHCRAINLASAECSILDMIRNEGFPARKLGGVWESDKLLIATWRRNRLLSDAPQEEPAAAPATSAATSASSKKPVVPARLRQDQSPDAGNQKGK
jgi:hypothetical protein